MNVRVVFNVIQQNLIAVNNSISFLSVFVTGLDLERNTTLRRGEGNFQLVASLIFFSAFLRQMKELS